MKQEDIPILQFDSQGHLTLGVEIELQLIDRETLDLTPAAPALFELTAGMDKIKPEIFQSMAEINSTPCHNVGEIEEDLRATLNIFRKATDRLGVLVATTGTHPFAKYSERKLYPAERYRGLIDRNQWIARRLIIFGLHVHIGMRDGDTCIRFNNFFLHLLPHLLALSASSPFWQGEPTGLASLRTTIFESSPTAGHPCRMKNWQEFSDLCDKLVRSKAIESMKDLWWDIRPSPGFGTLEIRACDGIATLSETLAIVGFIHALACWYDQHDDYNLDLRAPFMWMLRENKWRAARHGLDAQIIHTADADLIGIREDIALWLNRLEGQAKLLGYEPFLAGIQNILQKGASYQRQLRVFEASHGSLEAVVQHNAREFESGVPIYL